MSRSYAELSAVEAAMVRTSKAPHDTSDAGLAQWAADDAIINPTQRKKLHPYLQLDEDGDCLNCGEKPDLSAELACDHADEEQQFKCDGSLATYGMCNHCYYPHECYPDTDSDEEEQTPEQMMALSSRINADCLAGVRKQKEEAKQIASA